MSLCRERRGPAPCASPLPHSDVFQSEVKAAVKGTHTYWAQDVSQEPAPPVCTLLKAGPKSRFREGRSNSE